MDHHRRPVLAGLSWLDSGPRAVKQNRRSKNPREGIISERRSRYRRAQPPLRHLNYIPRPYGEQQMYHDDFDGPPADEHAEQVEEMVEAQRRYQDYLSDQEQVQVAPTPDVLDPKTRQLYEAKGGVCYFCKEHVDEADAEKLTLVVPERVDVLVHHKEILAASIKAARGAGLLRGGILGRALSTQTQMVAA